MQLCPPKEAKAHLASMPQNNPSSCSLVAQPGEPHEDAFSGNDSDSVTITRSTFLCENLMDSGKTGFISVPHLGLHGRGSTLSVARIFERWLLDPATRLATEPSDGPKSNILPVLKLSGDELVSSFISLLQQEVRTTGIGLSEMVSVRLRFGLTRFLKEHCDDQGVLIVSQEAGEAFPFYIESTFQTTPIGGKGASGEPGTPTSPVFPPFCNSPDDLVDSKNVVALPPSVNSDQAFSEIKFDVCVSQL